MSLGCACVQCMPAYYEAAIFMRMCRVCCTSHTCLHACMYRHVPEPDEQGYMCDDGVGVNYGMQACAASLHVCMVLKI